MQYLSSRYVRLTLKLKDPAEMVKKYHLNINLFSFIFPFAI